MVWIPFLKCEVLLLAFDGHQSYDFVFGQIRERHVFVLNFWRIFEIGIDQILDAAVVEKVVAHNLVVVVFDTHDDIGVIGRIRIGQGTNMLQKLGFPFSGMQIQLAFFVVKTALVIMRK